MSIAGKLARFLPGTKVGDLPPPALFERVNAMSELTRLLS